MVKFRLRTPREHATHLRKRAKTDPRAVEEYLDSHLAEWTALAEADPADAADILEELGEDAASDLLLELTSQGAAEVLDELRSDLAIDIVEGFRPEASARILAALTPMEAADIIGHLGTEHRDAVLKIMADDISNTVESLLQYPPDSAGGLMTTKVAALPVTITAGQAIEAVRKMHEVLEDLSYVYIVDDEQRLLGVLSFRDLVFNPPEVGLEGVMVAHPVTVTPFTDREEVAELATRYNLFGLPVVETNGRLLGMVTIEAVIDAVQQEASEDFAAAMGAGKSETPYSSISQSVRNRIPWLAVNLVLALGTLEAISRQSGVIANLPVLAALMPLVATLGGNAGAQSLAVTIRALATDDVPRSEIPGILGRQLAIGALSGLAVGTLAFAVSLTRADVSVAAVVGLASFTNLVIATSAGSGIPLLLRSLGLDPALASNIFVTLITDLTGFGGFLAMASVLLF